MHQITTVLGDIPPRQLGFCQCHEHLWINRGYPAAIHADQCIDSRENSLAELRSYRQAGGQAIVDAQPVGCGRNVELLAALSRESGVQIIASTGFHKLLFYPQHHWIYSAGEDTLTRLFTDELCSGMYQDGDEAFPARQGQARAGQVKAALDAGKPSGRYQTLFSAAAQAAQRADRPLMVHIEAGSDPIWLADFLDQQQVEPRRVIFCHMDRSVADLGLHREVCARGITLEYDTIARPKYHDDRREVEILLYMLEAGYENQLLMSLDVTRARLFHYADGVGLTYILTTFLPLLRQQGVGEAVIRRIFTENPANIYSHP